MWRMMCAVFGLVLLLSFFLSVSPAPAYVWKCHTPQGDIWTSQPGPSDDCEEYDEQYNPGAAPPTTQTPLSSDALQSVQPLQVQSQPVPPPPYVGTYLYPPYYYGPRFYGPGTYIMRPPFGYPRGWRGYGWRGYGGRGFGGGWHGGRFRR